MRFAACRNIHLALPRMQHFNRQVRRRSEAEQSDTLAGLHFRHAQAAKADDPSAQQRSGAQIVERAGKREDEVGARDSILGVAAVHGVSGECGCVAEVFLVMTAIPASAVGAADPRDADARCPAATPASAPADHVANDLVAGNQRRATHGQLAFGDVQIGAAYAAGADLQQNLTRRRVEAGNFFQAQRMISNRCGLREHCGFHGQSPSAKNCRISAAANGASQPDVTDFLEFAILEAGGWQRT